MPHRGEKYEFARKTIGYFPSHEGRYRDKTWSSFYGYMFIEDIHHHVMPIGGRSRKRSDFSIKVVPDDTTTKEVIELAFGNAGYQERRGTVTEVVSGFISDVSQQLAYFGRVHYEISRPSVPQQQELPTNDNENNTSQEKLFRLGYIPGRIVRIGNYYLQIIPALSATALVNRILSFLSPTFGRYNSRNYWVVHAAISSSFFLL